MSDLASIAARVRDARRWTLLGLMTADVGPVLALLILAKSTGFLDGRAAGLAVVVVVLPLLLRRAAPTAVLLFVTGGILLTARGIPTIWTDVAAIALASYTMGERAVDRTVSVAITFLDAAGLMTGLLLLGTDSLSSVTLPFVILLPSWLAGDIVRGRRLDAAANAEAAERAVADREAELRASAAEERRHVARELHDVVAHSVSVMVIQAGAARQVLKTTPDEAEASLLAVERTGRETMAELRTLLGVLGDDGESAAGEGAGIAPQPGLDRLETLLTRVRDAGLPTELETSGAVRPLPRGVDVTAYRIVQEALTNALRYADHAATLVQIGYEPSQLRIEVLDTGPGGDTASQGAAVGLAGLRERAAQVGGHLDAGPRLGGGWAVRAWLPLRADGA